MYPLESVLCIPKDSELLTSLHVTNQHHQETAIKAPFLEQFASDWKKKWIPSTAKKIVDGVEDEDLLAYRGEWNVEEGR